MYVPNNRFYIKNIIIHSNLIIPTSNRDVVIIKCYSRYRFLFFVYNFFIKFKLSLVKINAPNDERFIKTTT